MTFVHAYDNLLPRAMLTGAFHDPGNGTARRLKSLLRQHEVGLRAFADWQSASSNLRRQVSCFPWPRFQSPSAKCPDHGSHLDLRRAVESAKADFAHSQGRLPVETAAAAAPFVYTDQRSELTL